MATGPSPQVSLRALELLRAAAPSAVRIVRHPAGDTGGSVTLEEPNGKTSRLRLVPWNAVDTKDHQAINANRSGVLVWVVSRASAEQRRRWREANENFIDLSGAVRLMLRSLVIDRTDLARPAHAVADRIGHTRNPFADRASLVVRALLEKPKTSWSATSLAKTAGVSIATVSLVAESLREMGLISRGPGGQRSAIVLDDPTAVITAWTRRYDWRQNAAVTFATPMGSPDQFLKRLPAILGPADETLQHAPAKRARGRPRWALTLQAGASLLAPHADWDIVHVYVDVDSVADLIEIGARAGWPRAEAGRLVLMVPRYRVSVWYRASLIRLLPVVSGTQLLLDLWHYPVRGREQAEFMMHNAGWDRDRAGTGREP